MKFEKKVEQLRLEKYKGIETEPFLHDITRLAKGEPFEYVLGQVRFAGAVIDLSYKPMIPRPETEFWVKRMIEEEGRCSASEPRRALDLFSGSGCVGVALAKALHDCEVDMIELDPNLKIQMEKNIKINHLSSRAYVITGSVFDGAHGMYDIITAVPPYVRLENKEEVMKELQGEPELAFFDKEDGMYFHKQVLNKGKEFLTQSGRLYMETDNDQVERVKEYAITKGWNVQDVWNDPYGNPYLLVLQKVATN